jgi:hypothetical protein
MAVKRNQRLFWHCAGLLWVRVGFMAGSASAQPAMKPVGYFLTDTIEVGRPVRYTLSWRHSPAQDGIFPDTARAFTPFLVRDVAVFATETQQGISRDSAVYTVVSFETTPVQTLRVPIQLVSQTDCTQLWTGTDTVRLRSQLQTARPDTLALATDTTVQSLRQQLNYPVLAAALLGIAAGAALLYALFGRPIAQWLRLYRLAQRHSLFRRNYDRLTGGIRAETAAETTNQALILWCDYLQYLQNEPFNALTTREITEQLQKTGVVPMADEQLAEALHETDRVIYGGAFSGQSAVSLQLLRGVAFSLYQRRRDSMNNLSVASR